MYKRFEELLQKHGVSTYRVSKETKIAQSVFSAWKTGVSVPKLDKLQKIANYFGVTMEYLMGYDDPIGKDENVPTNEDSVRIPVLGRVVAGIPIDAIQDILDWEEIPKALAQHGEYFALQIKGESMMPRILPGDVVIVRKQSDADSADVVIAAVNGNDACCKRLIKHEDGIVLQSFNPGYAPMFFSNKEIAEKPVTILGKVVELRGKF